MDVAASDLLKGACYSLEQCGRLLKSACVLYREKDYSTAVGIAMLAREELGKHRILRDEWKNALQTGKSPSVAQIKSACEDHIKKQKRGQMSVTLMTERKRSFKQRLKRSQNTLRQNGTRNASKASLSIWRSRAQIGRDLQKQFLKKMRTDCSTTQQMITQGNGIGFQLLVCLKIHSLLKH